MQRINKANASLAVAVVAVFIALGGPAQAASLITGANVKNSSLTGADVKNSSLTGSDVKNSSLTGADVKSNALDGTDVKNIKGGDVADGSLTKSDFAAGQLPAGPAGAPGAPGAKGETGPAGPSRWVLVNNNGTIEAASDSGFRIANAYPNNSAGTGNVYIDSGDADLSNNGIVASIALANQYSQKGAGEPGTLNTGRNPGADNNPEFSGEITATKCAIAGVVGCAPNDVTPGGTGVSTNTSRYFVVSPRNSDGSYTGTTGATGPDGSDGPTLTTNTHKRFYVVISGPKD